MDYQAHPINEEDYRMKFKLCLITMIIGIAMICGCSMNREVDLYKNMVNSSVVLYNDFGFGSGVFIYDNIILTAAHVLEYQNLNIELGDGTILKVDGFYIDDKEDVGFIFVDANELCISKITFLCGNVGDTVYLVGTPYSRELKFTITKGILSHLDRDIYPWEDLLQVDAEGGPGSSGGPLYNSKGKVIGICVTGPNPGGGVTLCESAESILEAYERYKLKKIRPFNDGIECSHNQINCPH